MREKPTRTEDEPHERLTRIANDMITVMQAHREASGGEQAIVMLVDGERGGIGLHGFEDDREALAHMFSHLAAVFEANGMQLKLVPLGRG